MNLNSIETGDSFVRFSGKRKNDSPIPSDALLRWGNANNLIIPSKGSHFKLMLNGYQPIPFSKGKSNLSWREVSQLSKAFGVKPDGLLSFLKSKQPYKPNNPLVGVQ
jgi:hypothetical protein